MIKSIKSCIVAAAVLLAFVLSSASVSHAGPYSNGSDPYYWLNHYPKNQLDESPKKGGWDHTDWFTVHTTKNTLKHFYQLVVSCWEKGAQKPIWVDRANQLGHVGQHKRGRRCPGSFIHVSVFHPKTKVWGKPSKIYPCTGKKNKHGQTLRMRAVAINWVSSKYTSVSVSTTCLRRFDHQGYM